MRLAEKLAKKEREEKVLNRVYDIIHPGNNGPRARLVRARAPRFATGGKAWRYRPDAVTTRPDAVTARRGGVGAS